MEVEPILQLSTLRALCGEISALTMERPTKSAQECAAQLATLLQTKLLALSVTININIGFQTCKVVSLRPNYNADNDPQDTIVKELKLSVSNQDVGELSLGHLELAFDRSEAVASEMAGLEMIASLVSTGFLVSAREHFNDLLNVLAVHLNTTRFLNAESLFKDIEEALRTEGLRSLVVQMPSSGRFLGSDEDIKRIKNLQVADKIKDKGGSLSFYPAGCESDVIIEVCLPYSGVRIWLLTDRKKFQRELDFPSPWRDFLDRLAQMTDLALSEISGFADIDDQATRAQTELIGVAVTTGIFLHQIMNLTSEIKSLTDVLAEEYHLGQIQGSERYEKLLEMTGRSTEQLLGLVRSLSGATQDAHKPCSLLDAVNQCKKLFEVSLTQRRIQLEIDLSPDCIVDVPFNVAVFALANLISNARDAIWGQGLIRVFAEKSDSMIDCFVTDNGPGVPKEVINTLFLFGQTSKQGHSGWGLYLVSKSMQQNGGDIQLSRSDDTGTEFRLRFPAA